MPKIFIEIFGNEAFGNSEGKNIPCKLKKKKPENLKKQISDIFFNIL